MSTTIKIKGARPPEGESLYKSCRWVHMQRGFRESEETIFCNFNTLRPITFKVAEVQRFRKPLGPAALGIGEDGAVDQCRTRTPESGILRHGRYRC